METRSLAIGLVAVVAAFAAAFGLAKSGGSKTETAGAGVKAQSINLTAPAAVAGVEVGGTLPALKAQHKAPAKKKAKKPAASTNNTSQSSTSSSKSNSTTQAPSTSNTAPPTTHTAPPATHTAPPATSKPKPKPSNPAPVSGGGDDG
jgi:hypothetical protein